MNNFNVDTDLPPHKRPLLGKNSQRNERASHHQWASDFSTKGGHYIPLPGSEEVEERPQLLSGRRLQAAQASDKYVVLSEKYPSSCLNTGVMKTMVQTWYRCDGLRVT